jgi:FlaA1/EpsC-like NDP-sugar epimerase
VVKSHKIHMLMTARQARKYFAFLCLVLSDVVAIYLSFYIAFAIRAYILTRIFPTGFLYGVDFRAFTSRWYALALWIIVFGYEKLYTKRHSIWEETRILIKANSIVFGLITVAFFVLRDYFPFSRLILALAWLLGAGLFPTLRFVTKRFLILSGLWRKRVIVIGSSEATSSVIDAIKSDRTMGYKIVGCLTDENRGIARRGPHLRPLRRSRGYPGADAVRGHHRHLPQPPP